MNIPTIIFLLFSKIGFWKFLLAILSNSTGIIGIKYRPCTPNTKLDPTGDE